MHYELIVLALVCLIAPWFGKIAGFEIRRKPFDLVAVAGILFLLAAAFDIGMMVVDGLRDIGHAFMLVAIVFGWIALFAGAVWGTFDVLREPADHGLMAHKA